MYLKSTLNILYNMIMIGVDVVLYLRATAKRTIIHQNNRDLFSILMTVKNAWFLI